MRKINDYKAVARLNMSDPKFKLLNKLNIFALISVIVSCVIGILLNYCLRMMGESGGMYFLYIIGGFVLCIVYPYVHELAHAFAIIAVKRTKPFIKFGKLAAYCGAPDTVFSKIQYFFVVSFPFVFYCLLLVPLCVFVPAVYFPLPFMPLAYNVFGSIADGFMFGKASRAPRDSIIIDSGTEIVIYAPRSKNDE